MGRETALQQHIRLALGKQADVRLWRNNCGKLPDPRTGRWVEFGVANPGGSDLIGFRNVRITPEMVGRDVAIFVGLEIKAPDGRVREAQERFLSLVRTQGGISGVARSVADALRIVNQPIG